jgi:hypothetical protein
MNFRHDLEKEGECLVKVTQWLLELIAKVRKEDLYTWPSVNVGNESSDVSNFAVIYHLLLQFVYRAL